MSSKKRVLILGAGMCVPSLAHYLADHDYQVLLCSRTTAPALEIIKNYEGKIESHVLDIETEEGMETLERLAPTVDAVVSMVPYTYHPKAAVVAIKHKKHFFTSSYVGDAMKALNQDAINANVILLNECGVNPGINHMNAMKIINEIHEKAGKVTSFIEYVGGLPAPQHNNNPLGYKFSWAPRGVLLATLNSARFLENGKEVVLPGETVFNNYRTVEVEELGLKFETYPNRDSIPYATNYGIQNETHTMLRANYRNIGWCPTIYKLQQLGYFSLETKTIQGSYAQLTRSLVQAEQSSNSLKSDVAAFLKISEDDPILGRFEWLGLFSDTEIIPSGTTCTLDALCAMMKQKMQFAPGELDMIVMKQFVEAEYPDGKKERTVSALISFGVPNGDSCMARTVGLPLAMAIHLVLQGKLSHLKGIQTPVLKEITEPVLKELEEWDIKITTRTEAI